MEEQHLLSLRRKPETRSLERIISQKHCSSVRDTCQRGIGFYKVNKQPLVSIVREGKGSAKFRISWTVVSTLPSAVGGEKCHLLPARSTLFQLEGCRFVSVKKKDASCNHLEDISKRGKCILISPGQLYAALQ